MKHPSPKDIEEMRSRGYEPSTIERAQEQSKRWHLAQDLAGGIREAFAGVTLGNGIGLRQAQGIDGYEDQEAIAAYRLADEKDNWSRIPIDALNECQSSLSFFDAEGMRFHLPAYLLADIEGTYLHGTSFHLAHLSDHSQQQFMLLSQEQRDAISAYLRYIADEENYAFERPNIIRALEEYWTK